MRIRYGLGAGLMLASGFAGFMSMSPRCADGGAAPAPPSAGVSLLAPGAQVEHLFRVNNRGAALMEQFKHGQAMEEFARATALAPGWAPGHVNLGLAALYARQMERAESAFREAVRLDPALIEGHYGLALLLKSQGRTPEALAAFEAARERDPDDADILYNIGLLHARQREFAPAIKALGRAREIDPNGMSIRYQLARALVQAGETAKGEAEMAAYQKLAANPKFSQPTGNQYGEGGRYAIVLTDYRAFGGPAPAAPPAQVRWSDATPSSGVLFVQGGPGGDPGTLARGGGSKPGASVDQIAARFGSGLAVADFDGDGQFDLVFANGSADGKARPAVYRNKGGFAFEDVTTASGVGFQGAGVAASAADYDNDGDVDLCLTHAGGAVLYRNEGGGRFKDVTVAAGVRVTGLATGASWGDLDHDGDLDLLVARLGSAGGSGSGPPVLMLNRGDGTFEDRSAAHGIVQPSDGSIGALFTDLDLDRDIDIVLSATNGPDALLDNRREGGFADIGPAAGLAAKGQGRGVAAGDLNGDGYVDLIFPAGAAGANAIRLNGPHRPLGRAELPRAAGAWSAGVAPADFDNDGDLDLFFTGSVNQYLVNDGTGRFKDQTLESGLATTPFKDGRGAAAADLDGDGDLDLVLSRNGGRALLLRNEGGSRNRFLDVVPKGLNSNRGGVGSKVELLSGPVWQRREVYAGSGYLSSGPTTVHFGLGSRSVADVVRLLWPGGVLQAELDAPAGQRLEPQELDRKGSSCPLLFAWNGAKYGFVTDFLGVGGLGLWLAPGVYSKPDPDEYVKVEPDQLRPLEGGYYFQVVENLEEVTYLDQARLLAIDHPQDIDVFPNENFAGPPSGEHRLYAVRRRDRIFPTRANDVRGRDVLDRVLKIDRTYPDDFRLLNLAGYAEMHHLTLEFPESVEGREGLILFLYGWVDFEYSSSNYAAHQSGLTQTLPVLEMEDAEGQFKPVINPMGFPPGMPRMMTVDLAALGPLPKQRLRLRSNMRVYWDQVFLAAPLDEAATRDALTVSESKLGAAHLHRRGYPREHSPDGRQPRVYDYGIMDNSQPFRLMSGDYTRFGKVTELLTAADDRFVIFGRGEEVTLEFLVKGLPVIPKGSIRSFVVHTTGFCKDMDPHTAHGETVEPLPFRGMSAYPYPEGESYPDDPLHRGYRRDWNTRRLEGR